MLSRRFTPGGNPPPSCKYWCTASRPVNTTPVIETSSPTFSARILDSVNGLVSWIIIVGRVLEQGSDGWLPSTLFSTAPRLPHSLIHKATSQSHPSGSAHRPAVGTPS